MFKSVKSLLAASAVTTLVACGGGGGGSSAPVATGPVTSSLSFPLRSSLNTRVANGFTYTLTANGTSATQITNGLCSGTVTETVGPANNATTFEGVAALSATSVVTITFTNCTPPSTAETATEYYDGSYLPLGFNVSGGSYAVYPAPQLVPNTITVGATGIIGTVTYYTDSTKAVGNGRSDRSFAVEADTATTAIVNLISKRYNSASQLLVTSQARYRIDATGSLTILSIDVQYATTSTTRLLFK